MYGYLPFDYEYGGHYDSKPSDPGPEPEPMECGCQFVPARGGPAESLCAWASYHGRYGAVLVSVVNKHKRTAFKFQAAGYKGNPDPRARDAARAEADRLT